MEMQREMKRNMEVYRQPFSHSLYYYKLESFQLSNVPKGDAKFFPWRRETERREESLCIPCKNNIKK